MSIVSGNKSGWDIHIDKEENDAKIHQDIARTGSEAMNTHMYSTYTLSCIEKEYELHKTLLLCVVLFV